MCVVHACVVQDKIPDALSAKAFYIGKPAGAEGSLEARGARRNWQGARSSVKFVESPTLADMPAQ